MAKIVQTAGRNFHKQTIGRFLKFCEHSVSSKDMSEPIGEFIFLTYNKQRSKIKNQRVCYENICRLGKEYQLIIVFKISKTTRNTIFTNVK